MYIYNDWIILVMKLREALTFDNWIGFSYWSWEENDLFYLIFDN